MASKAWTALWIALALSLVVRAGVRDRGVISDHLEFGRRVLAGSPLYAPFEDPGQPLHAPYPPGFGVLTAPLSLLSERLARIGWALLQVGALWAIGRWLAQGHAATSPPLRSGTRSPGVGLQPLLLITALITSRYVLRDAHGGGGNLINLACALTGVALASRRATLSASVLLGLSLATKPTHALLLPLLCAFGRGRVAVGAAAAAAAWTGLALLALRQGWQPLAHWAEGTWRYATQPDLFAPPSHGFPPFSWMNQCLRCAVARWCGIVPTAWTDQVAWMAPGLGLAPADTAPIARAFSLALLGVTALVVVRRRHAPTAALSLIAAVCSLSLLLSPVSWKAHHVALIPAVFLLVSQAAAGRRGLWWPLLIYTAVCLPGAEFTGKAYKEILQSHYAFTAGTLLLWGLCLREALRAGSAPQPNETG
ncbi:MAG: glycosyltransferase 87 family protein [Planctomycetota bacterium]